MRREQDDFITVEIEEKQLPHPVGTSPRISRARTVRFRRSQIISIWHMPPAADNGAHEIAVTLSDKQGFAKTFRGEHMKEQAEAFIASLVDPPRPQMVKVMQPDGMGNVPQWISVEDIARIHVDAAGAYGPKGRAWVTIRGHEATAYREFDTDAERDRFLRACGCDGYLE